MKEFVYTKERPCKLTTWCFAIKANLDEERKAAAIAIARDLYEKRFHRPAPNHKEHQSGNAIMLMFLVAEQSEQLLLPFS